MAQALAQSLGHREMGGVCADSQDHIFIAQRVNDVGGMDGHLEGLTNDELNAGQAALL